MNTNMNTDGETEEDIPGSESPEDHVKTVWKNIVAKNIVIIAHSYGGVVTMELATARSFQDRFLRQSVGSS